VQKAADNLGPQPPTPTFSKASAEPIRGKTEIGKNSGRGT